MKQEIGYLKQKFETNDTPLQEDFYDWMDSYWHKDEKIPLEGVNIDLTSKADKTSENLSAGDIASWKAKLNEPSQITITTGTNITTDAKDSNGSKMYGKNVIVANGTGNINLQCLSTTESDFLCTITKAGTGTITITAGSGVTIVQTDYTNVLNGGIGSTAKLQRIGSVYYLRIFNA